MCRCSLSGFRVSIFLNRFLDLVSVLSDEILFLIELLVACEPIQPLIQQL